MPKLSGLIRLASPRSRSLRLGLLLAALEAIFAVGLLATSAWLISRAAQQPPILYLNMAIVGVRGFALGRAFFRYTQRLALHDAAFRQLTQLRPYIFKKLATLAPAGLGLTGRSDGITRLTQDVDELQNLTLRVATPIWQATVATLATVACLAFVSPSSQAWLAMLGTAVISAALALGVSNLLGSRAATKSVEVRASLNSLTAGFLENLELLKAYGWDVEYRSQIEANEKALLSSGTRQNLVTGIGTALFSLLATIAVVVTTALGAGPVTSGLVDRPLMAVIALLPLAAFEFLSGMHSAVPAWQRFKASATRIQQAMELEAPVSIATNEGQVELGSIQQIRLSGVSAKYPGSNVAVLRDFDLELNRGEVVALRGPSGSGKSTMAFVLAGFLRPTAGAITINGRDQSEYTEASLRTRIGYLEQQPMIFDGTLRVNLGIGSDSATDLEMWAVLERVGLAATFRSREGLETQLGQFGSKVSGGEAQRIALARALLADFDVFIMDEPTANVDSETAELLWKDLLRIADKGHRIWIFITHEDQRVGGFSREVRL